MKVSNMKERTLCPSLYCSADMLRRLPSPRLVPRARSLGHGPRLAYRVPLAARVLRPGMTRGASLPEAGRARPLCPSRAVLFPSPLRAPDLGMMLSSMRGPSTQHGAGTGRTGPSFHSPTLCQRPRSTLPASPSAASARAARAPGTHNPSRPAAQCRHPGSISSHATRSPPRWGRDCAL